MFTLAWNWISLSPLFCLYSLQLDSFIKKSSLSHNAFLAVVQILPPLTVRICSDSDLMPGCLLQDMCQFYFAFLFLISFLSYKFHIKATHPKPDSFIYLSANLYGYYLIWTSEAISSNRQKRLCPVPWEVSAFKLLTYSADGQVF